MDCAEVYDLSTAMELEWYEQIGLCAVGEAENLIRNGDTTIEQDRDIVQGAQYQPAQRFLRQSGRRWIHRRQAIGQRLAGLDQAQLSRLLNRL